MLIKSADQTVPTATSHLQFNPRVYWEDRLSQNHGLLGVGNTMLGERYNEWQYRLRRSVFLREMSALHSDWHSRSILDVASGMGFYIQLWKQLGAGAIAGCDLTDTSVTALRRAFPDFPFRQLDITCRSVLPVSTYDVISAFDVLFHIVNDDGFEQALKNIYAALRPDGLFVFSEMFVHGARRSVTHVVSRTFEEIHAAISRTGFQIERRAPMFITMNIPLDSNIPLHMFLWNVFSHLVHRSELLGYLSGAVLFSVDSILTQLLHESPTTELMICRKRA